MAKYVGVKTEAADLNLSPGFLNHVNAPMFADKPIPVYPSPGTASSKYVMSNWPCHLAFVELLKFDLNAFNLATAKDRDPSGLVFAGYVGSADSLEAVSGYLMKPALFPPLRDFQWEVRDRMATKAELAASRLGLKEKTKPEQELYANVPHWINGHHKKIVQEVAGCYFGGWVHGRTHFPIQTSSGYWMFTTEEGIKRQAIDDVPERVRCYQVSLAKGVMYDFDKGAGLVGSKATRSQPEKKNKQRPITSFAGVPVIADKNMDPLPACNWDGSDFHFPDICRRRARHATGCSMPSVAPQTFMLRGFDLYALSRYSYTWKHTSIMDLNAKARGWKYAIPSDDALFDSQQSALWLRTILNVWITRIKPEFQQAFYRMLDAWLTPAMLQVEFDVPSRARGDNERQYRLTCDPLQNIASGGEEFQDRKTPGGLTGSPPNPRTNKIIGTSIQVFTTHMALWVRWLACDKGRLKAEEVTEKLLTAAIKAVVEMLLHNEDVFDAEAESTTYDHEGVSWPIGVPIADIDRALKGLHPHYAWLNMGDDCVGFMNDDLLRRCCMWSYTNFPALVVEVDFEGKFVGCNVTRDPHDGSLFFQPNAISDPCNYFMPEFGFGDPIHRPYAAAGFDIRQKLHYGNHPLAKEIAEGRRRAWKSVYQTKLTIEQHFAAHASLPYEPENFDQLRYVTHPDAHHYQGLEIDNLTEEDQKGKFITIEPEHPSSVFIAQCMKPEYIVPKEDLLKFWVAPDFVPTGHIHPYGGYV